MIGASLLYTLFASLFFLPGDGCIFLLSPFEVLGVPKRAIAAKQQQDNLQ